MLARVFKWLIMSVIIIFISHHLYEFYISSHSPPKLRDIQNERKAEYEMLRKMAPREGWGNDDMNHQETLPTITQQPIVKIPPPPSTPQINDKDTLKEFMRQINGTECSNDSTPI